MYQDAAAVRFIRTTKVMEDVRSYERQKTEDVVFEYRTTYDQWYMHANSSIM